MDRKERMNKVFDYLQSQGLVHTQKDFAKRLESTGPNISKMLKGDPKVLTDSMCRRIQKNFKMISADWLISGEGEMIVATNNNKTATNQIPLPDYSSLMNATIAAKDEAIASLKRELEAKDMLVSSLMRQVNDLSFALSALKGKSTSGYPSFPLGVAEEDSIAANKNTETTAKFPSHKI